MGDNFIKFGIYNLEFYYNYIYVFYMEIVIKFENIIWFSFVKYLKYFIIDLMNIFVEGFLDDENGLDFYGIVVGIVFGIIFIFVVVLICIVIKRLGKDICISIIMIKLKYEGNREINFWLINGNFGILNLM